MLLHKRSDMSDADADVAHSHNTDEQGAHQSLHAILDMLHKHKYALDSLFRYLDDNGDGEISTKEFKQGILSLKKQFGEQAIDEQQVDK